MAEAGESGVLRAMTAAHVPNVLDVQEPGAVRGLAGVFPQDAHPFPREEVAQRWLQEIEVPDIDCYVILVDDAVAGTHRRAACQGVRASSRLPRSLMEPCSTPVSRSVPARGAATRRAMELGLGLELARVGRDVDGMLLQRCQ